MVDQNIDAGKATEFVRKYCEENYGNLAFISFRIHFVKPNDKKDVWIVKFSFKPQTTEDTRIYNIIKVNIANKEIDSIEEVQE